MGVKQRLEGVMLRTSPSRISQRGNDRASVRDARSESLNEGINELDIGPNVIYRPMDV